MNQQELYEICEKFVGQIYSNYPRLFKSMNEIMTQYHENPSLSKTYISQSLLSLLKNDQVLETQLFELLSTSQEPPSNLTLEIVNQQISNAFQIIQDKRPEKMQNLIEFFQEKTNGLQNQTEPKEIQKTAIQYFNEFFKDDSEILNLTSNCFVVKEKKTPPKICIETSPPPKKKRNIGPSLSQTPTKLPYLASPMTFKHNHHHVINKPQVEISPEELFFQNLGKRLKENEMIDFSKMFFLYLENIISSYELFNLVSHLFSDESEFLCFRNMINSKEVAHRKAATYFKPYGDSDLSSSLVFFYSNIKIRI